MAAVDRGSLPLAVHVARASPHEVPLVAATVRNRFLAEYPPRPIGDRAQDSDPLAAELRATLGIGLIAPHRDHRVRPATQDGRALRRYKRRCVVERFLAWLRNSRRLATRWGRHVESFVAILQLGCTRVLLNR